LALLIIIAIKEARNRIVSAILTGIATEIDWESSSNSEIRDPSSEQNEQRSPTESEFRPPLPSNRIEKGRKVLSERHQKKTGGGVGLTGGGKSQKKLWKIAGNGSSLG